MSASNGTGWDCPSGLGAPRGTGGFWRADRI